MIRLTPFLLALTTPALAEPPYAADTGDTIELRQCDPWPCIYYLNDAAQSSGEVEQRFKVHGSSVVVTIEVTAAHETIRVRPDNNTIIADPPYAEVDDGADIYINLILPLY